MEFTGIDGLTATKDGKLPMRAIGVKSLIGSYGTLLNRPFAAAGVGLVVKKSVSPSGFARATALAAGNPPAPARFSITTDWPSASCRYCPIMRAAASVALPAANGVMIVMVRVG